MDGWGWSTPLTESYFISLFAQEKGRGRCRQLWVDGLRLCTHLEAFFKVKYTEKTNSFCLAKEFVLNASCPSTTATTCGIIRRIRGCSSVFHHRNVPTPEHRMYERTSERAHPPPQQQPYVTLCGTTQMLLWSSVGHHHATGFRSTFRTVSLYYSAVGRNFVQSVTVTRVVRTWTHIQSQSSAIELAGESQDQVRLSEYIHNIKYN